MDDVEEPVGAPDVVLAVPEELAAPDDVFDATVPEVLPWPCCWVLPVFESSSPQPAAVRPTPRTTIV